MQPTSQIPQGKFKAATGLTVSARYSLLVSTLMISNHNGSFSKHEKKITILTSSQPQNKCSHVIFGTKARGESGEVTKNLAFRGSKNHRNLYRNP